jgi:hypothetical protein
MADVEEPTLRHGDEAVDGWVEYLQTLLHGWGYADVSTNGVFDDATHAAVCDWQGRRGLLVDGVVGNQTWASLRENDPEAIGTDGREPGTYVEQGAEARWQTEHSTALYDESEDRLKLLAVNTGGETLELDRFTCDATIENADRSVSLTLPLAMSTRSGEPAGPGEPFQFFAFNVKPGLGAGTFSVAATMPTELGSDEMSDEFTIPE